MVKLLIELQALDFGFLAKLPDGKKLAITTAETLQNLIAELVKELGEKVLKSVKDGSAKPNVLHTVYVEVGSSDDTASPDDVHLESSNKLIEKLKALSATQRFQVESAIKTIVGGGPEPTKATVLTGDNKPTDPGNVPGKQIVHSPSQNSGVTLGSDPAKKPGVRNLG